MFTEECTIKTWRQWLVCFVIAGFVTFLFYDPENTKLNLYWFSSALALSLFAFELVSMVVAILTLLMFYISFPEFQRLMSSLAVGWHLFHGWF